MTIEEKIKLYGGKEKWTQYYSLFDKCMAEFIEKAKLDHSEHSFDILKSISNDVIEDIGESWYRRSLGKVKF